MSGKITVTFLQIVVTQVPTKLAPFLCLLTAAMFDELILQSLQKPLQHFLKGSSF